MTCDPSPVCGATARQRPPLEDENDTESKNERQDQIEEPEHQQGCNRVGLRHVRHSLEKRDLKNPEPARSMADQRQRERGEKNAENRDEPGIGGPRNREKNDSGRPDQLERPGKQLPRRHRRARIDKLRTPPSLSGAKMQQGS